MERIHDSGINSKFPDPYSFLLILQILSYKASVLLTCVFLKFRHMRLSLCFISVICVICG